VHKVSSFGKSSKVEYKDKYLPDCEDDNLSRDGSPSLNSEKNLGRLTVGLSELVILRGKVIN